MAKEQFIQIRVSDILKQRYLTTLKEITDETGVTENATTHLTREIFKFVEAHEKKKKQKEKAALSQ